MEDAIERGVLLLDKPAELTSMQCVEIAKRLLKARKAGHSGTLDPRVTGLMLIAFNEAVKAMPVLSGLDKAYEGVMRVHGPFKRGDLSGAFRRFTGRITQVPPRRSAVARKPREREVYSLEILSVKDRDVSFRVSCQAGTYVRKLCSDIGDSLGTGAHMASLRRTGIGPFSIEESVTMEQFRAQKAGALIRLEGALDRAGLPRAVASDDSLRRLRNGIPLEPSELDSRPRGLFGIYDPSGSIVSLSRIEDGKARPERIFC